jgi:hypothetical protein
MCQYMKKGVNFTKDRFCFVKVDENFMSVNINTAEILKTRGEYLKNPDIEKNILRVENLDGLEENPVLILRAITMIWTRYCQLDPLLKKWIQENGARVLGDPNSKYIEAIKAYIRDTLKKKIWDRMNSLQLSSMWHFLSLLKLEPLGDVLKSGGSLVVAQAAPTVLAETPRSRSSAEHSEDSMRDSSGDSDLGSGTISPNSWDNLRGLMRPSRSSSGNSGISSAEVSPSSSPRQGVAERAGVAVVPSSAFFKPAPASAAPAPQKTWAQVVLANTAPS